MAQVERLIVELDAKVDKYLKDMKKVEGENKKVGKSSKEMGASFLKAGTVIAGAATLAGAAIIAIAVNAAKSQRELEILSRQTKLSVQDFQAIAFATEQAGISGEKFSDISKDLADRIGEFTSEMKGEFETFTKAIGLNKEQAFALAKEYEKLSSKEVLGDVVKRMQEAGLSSDQMTAALEALANDSSRLIPIFQDNSKELKRLETGFNDVTKSLALTSQQTKDLKVLGETSLLLGKQFELLSIKVGAVLAPAVTVFLQGIIDIVDVTIDAAKRINAAFGEIKEPKTLAEVQERIVDLDERRLNLQAQIAEKQQADLGFLNVREGFIKKDLEDLRERLGLVNDELGVLKEQSEVLEKNQELKKPEDTDGGGGGAPTFEELKAEAEVQALQKSLQAFEDSTLTKMELAEVQFAREMEIIELSTLAGEAKDKLIESSEQKRINAILKAEESAAKAKRKLDTDNVKNVISIGKLLVGNSKAAAQAVFVVEQGLAANEVFVSTQAASVRALAELGPIVGAPVAAAIETNGAIKLALIAAATISGFPGGGGGGGISGGGGGGGGGGQTITNAPEDFAPETSTLEVTEQTEGGGQQTMMVTFATDTGDELIDVLGRGLNRGMREGRV